MRRFRFGRPIVMMIAVMLGLSLVACASLPLKQKLAVSLSASVDALGAFQQTERNLYAEKAIPQLTPKVHENISSAISKAADAQITASSALLAWHAGDPVPTTVTQTIAYGQETYDVIVTLFPKLQTNNAKEQLLVTTLQGWLKELVNLAKGFNLSVPAWAQ